MVSTPWINGAYNIRCISLEAEKPQDCSRIVRCIVPARLSFIVPPSAGIIMLSRVAFLPLKVPLFTNNTSFVIRVNNATLTTECSKNNR